MNDKMNKFLKQHLFIYLFDIGVFIQRKDKDHFCQRIDRGAVVVRRGGCRLHVILLLQHSLQLLFNSFI